MLLPEAHSQIRMLCTEAFVRFDIATLNWPAFVNVSNICTIKYTIKLFEDTCLLFVMLIWWQMKHRVCK